MKTKKEIMNLLQEGEAVTLEEILQAREIRAGFQYNYITQFPNCTLAAFKLNVPGSIKTNKLYSYLFETGISKIESKLAENSFSIITHEKKWLSTGDEAYWIIDSKPEKIKQEMVYIEEHCELGRIYDIDILYIENDEMKDVKRKDIEAHIRKCFVCSKNAKECARNQTHTKMEIYGAMANIILEKISR